jgi:ATP-dependent protease ClpP protease subunit
MAKSGFGGSFQECNLCVLTGRKMPKMPTIKENKNAAKVYAYGMIGDDMIGRMVEQLHLMGMMVDDCINLHLNSIGGSIPAGMAGYTTIRGCAMPVDVYVDGIAASMGAFMALGGRKLYMTKYARLMIHAGRTGDGGTAEALRENADLLEGYDRDLCAMVCAKTGMTEADAKARFFDGADHWLTADEAIALKVCDGIYEADVDMAEAVSHVEVYAVLSDAYQKGVFKTNNNFMEAKLDPQALAALGLGAEATPAQITAALTAQAAKVNEMTLKLAGHENRMALAAKAEVTAVLEEALTAGKITTEYQAVLATQYDGKPEELKTLVAAMPAFASVNSKLNPAERGGATQFKPEAVALMALGWDKLDKTDQLKSLKAADENAFLALYKTKFGYGPNEKPIPQAVQQEIRKRQSFPGGKGASVV